MVGAYWTVTLHDLRGPRAVPVQASAVIENLSRGPPQRNAQHARRRAPRVGERERLRLRLADVDRPVVEGAEARDRRPCDRRRSSGLARGGSKHQRDYSRSCRTRGPDNPNQSKYFHRCMEEVEFVLR